MNFKRLLSPALALFAAAVIATAEEETTKLPKLLDLGAHVCIPCKKMEPILEELKKDYAEHFETVFVDVWQKKNATTAKKHGIQSIPTQIFFDAEGRELWRHEGFISKDDILTKWKELGYTFEAALSDKAKPSNELNSKSSKAGGGCCGQ